MIIYAVLIAILLSPIAVYWIAKIWLSSFISNKWLLNSGAVLVVLATYAVLLLDQVPFYWYAQHRYAQDGGVWADNTAPDEKGYMMAGHCEFPGERTEPSQFSSLCYYQLFDSPSQRRVLEFIEFELNQEQAKATTAFYQKKGPGVYRIQLEEKPLSECLVLQALQANLARVDPHYLERDFSSGLRILEIAKVEKKCPVVRKADTAKSKYREGWQNQLTVIFSDGVHKIYRSDRRNWVTMDGSSSLYRSVNYCVEGAIILWGKKSDVWPADPCVGPTGGPSGNLDPFGVYLQSKNPVQK